MPRDSRPGPRVQEPRVPQRHLDQREPDWWGWSPHGAQVVEHPPVPAYSGPQGVAALGVDVETASAVASDATGTGRSTVYGGALS